MRRGRVVLDVIVDRSEGEVLLLRSGTFLFGEYLKSKRRWIPAKAGIDGQECGQISSIKQWDTVAGAICLEKMDSRFRGKDGKECGQFS